MSETTTATVATLTAEVRVLMVGSRQVTLSVARQLDRVALENMEPFGRVKLGSLDEPLVIGRRREDGALVLARYRTRFDPPAIWLCDLQKKIIVPARNRRDEDGWYLINWRARTIAVQPEAAEPCDCYGGCICKVWSLNGNDETVLDEAVARSDAEDGPDRAAARLPLIVLAGLK